MPVKVEYDRCTNSTYWTIAADTKQSPRGLHWRPCPEASVAWQNDREDRLLICQEYDKYVAVLELSQGQVYELLAVLCVALGLRPEEDVKELA